MSRRMRVLVVEGAGYIGGAVTDILNSCLYNDDRFQMISEAYSQRNERHRRIGTAAHRKDGRAGHVDVVHAVYLAIQVDDRAFRIRAHARRPHMMGSIEIDEPRQLLP